ncbi:C69 family dipeptidase [Clostridium sp.]|uniref:C69 family dipeptidase n=1 Tax=Clostridium sp. TaxID=1506 RepID=UPI002FC6C5C4
MCTTVLVGKKASIDGSTIIGRNDDTFLPYNPQRFYVQAANNEQSGTYVSNKNGFTAKIPKVSYRYQFVPNVDTEKEGIFGESGFNEKNVGMSATESVYANERVLAYDPLLSDGLAEDSMTLMVLPYIHSARHGVEYLGNLIKEHGSAEGNGIIFSDKDDVWYMSIVTGHHWVAQRIPDDSCCVIANQVAIQEVDFNDHENFMWSEGIQEFVEKNHLNTNLTGWNFRRIFGTSTEKDRHYNTPRVWFGQKFLNPEIKQEPTSSNLPFIFHANRKISVEDVQYILSSHYDETEYDPYGKGTDEEKYLFRPVSLNRTQNSHILQVRNTVPEQLSALMWICVGVPAHTPYVPFYGNANDTDPSYSNTKLEWNMDDAYWMYRTVTALVEGHYSKLLQSDLDYLKECRETLIRTVSKIDEEGKNLKNEALTDFLTKKNYETVAKMREITMKFIGQLVVESVNLSKLTFDIDKNL